MRDRCNVCSVDGRQARLQFKMTMAAMPARTAVQEMALVTGALLPWFEPELPEDPLLP